MVVKEIEFYEIDIKLLIVKKWWDKDHGKMSKDIIIDKIQEGIETPIEEYTVNIK